MISKYHPYALSGSIGYMLGKYFRSVVEMLTSIEGCCCFIASKMLDASLWDRLVAYVMCGIWLMSYAFAKFVWSSGTYHIEKPYPTIDDLFILYDHKI